QIGRFSAIILASLILEASARNALFGIDLLVVGDVRVRRVALLERGIGCSGAVGMGLDDVYCGPIGLIGAIAIDTRSASLIETSAGLPIGSRHRCEPPSSPVDPLRARVLLMEAWRVRVFSTYYVDGSIALRRRPRRGPWIGSHTLVAKGRSPP